MPDFVPANARGKLILEARLHLAAMASLAVAGVAFGWTWILTLWVIPALLGQPFLRAYLMAEHGACPLVANMLANSRTTYTNRWSVFSPGTCPSTAPIMPCRPFRSIACPTLNRNLETRLKVTAQWLWRGASPDPRLLAATSSAADRSTP